VLLDGVDVPDGAGRRGCRSVAMQRSMASLDSGCPPARCVVEGAAQAQLWVPPPCVPAQRSSSPSSLSPPSPLLALQGHTASWDFLPEWPGRGVAEQEGKTEGDAALGSDSARLGFGEGLACAGWASG
jgi:hypothetical protein